MPEFFISLEKAACHSALFNVMFAENSLFHFGHKDSVLTFFQRSAKICLTSLKFKGLKLTRDDTKLINWR